METRIHSTPMTPVGAKQYVSDLTGTVVLSFAQDGHGNEVSIYLPWKMRACVAMIVEAFNAHMQDEMPASHPHVGGLRYGDASFPTGSARRVSDAITISRAIAEEIEAAAECGAIPAGIAGFEFERISKAASMGIKVVVTDDDAMAAVERRDLP